MPKQSSFRPATTPLTGDETVDLIQGGKNRRTSLNNFLARAFARANHTGTQDIDTVDGLEDALAGKATPAQITAAIEALEAELPGTYAVPADVASSLAPLRQWPAAEDGSTFATRFASGHGWASSVGSGGSVDLNSTEQAAFGSQSIKVASGAGAASYAEKGSLALNLSASSLLVWIYVVDPAAPLIIYAGDSSLTNHYFWVPSLSDVGWHVFELWTANATAAGSPNPAAIDKIRLRVSSGGLSAYFGAIATRPASTVYPNGVVTLCFDDSGASQWSRARPKMDAYGYPGVSHVVADRIGSDDATYMTLANLRQMRDLSGWEIAGHSATLAGHVNMTTLTDAQVDAELFALKKWLLENNFRSDSWASPQGQSNAAVWAVARRYFNMHRTVSTSVVQPSVPFVAPERVRAMSWDAAANGVAAVQTQIALAKTQHSHLILCFHAITAGASSGISISQTDFDAIIDYIAAQAVPVRTFAQVLAESTSSLATVAAEATSRAAADASVLALACSDYLLAGGGETALPRTLAANEQGTNASGVLGLTYFTAKLTETITQVRMRTGATAAAATPSLCRIGIWSVNAAGDLVALLASIPNDTTLFAAANTAYTRTLSASWSKVAGNRYAAGAIVVSAAATPTFVGVVASGGVGAGLSLAAGPRVNGVRNSLADLPSSETVSNIANSGRLAQVEFLP